MKKIHKLSPLLISKIAAGEVIERSSFAVKELIENAIDAGATEIKVYIEEAGLKKIQVIDNGAGMSKEDILESWKPHTTSKIKEENELHSIKSLGFRGEALASLAAVSTLTIQGRLKSEKIGFQVVIKEGRLVNSSPIGMPIGTTIIAEQLFATTPVRKKFLKSRQSELRQIITVMNHFSVAYPSIHFTLTHGKRTILDFPKTNDLSERIEQLVGTDAFSFFIPIQKSESYLSITGFIAKPQLSTTTQNKQYVFVNDRKVNDKMIAQAVKEAYGTMLESTTYPLFVLFLSLPFEMVDVNVHPRKEEIAFLNSQFMFQTIKQAITDVLSEHNITFQNLSWKRRGVGMTHSFAGNLLKETVLKKELLVVNEQTTLFQLNRTYIVVSTNNGLLLVDQHAAHERILFEKLIKEFLKEKNKHKIYALQKPVLLKLTETEKVLLDEHKEVLKKIGFKIQKQTLTHIPLLFQDRNPQELVMSIINSTEETGVKIIDTISEEMLAFLACRAAVKAGDILSRDHMKKILSDLETTPNNTTCPHARPTKILIQNEEINSMFKRK